MRKIIIFRKLKTWWRKRDNIEEPAGRTQWEKDYDLEVRNSQGLFYEYLEMGRYLLFLSIVIGRRRYN